jgi:hypothetical protein
VIAIR